MLSMKKLKQGKVVLDMCTDWVEMRVHKNGPT